MTGVDLDVERVDWVPGQLDLVCVAPWCEDDDCPYLHPDDGGEGAA